MKYIQTTLVLFFFVLSSCDTVVHRDYYSNDTLKEEYSLRNGKFIGDYRAFYSDGKPSALGRYKNGKMDGMWQYFYESGKRQSIEDHVNGKLVNFNYWDENGIQLVINGTGVAERYDSYGVLESVMSYRNCVFHGKLETWFSNGVKSSEFFYDSGRPVGVWSYWDEFGELIKTEEYFLTKK